MSPTQPTPEGLRLSVGSDLLTRAILPFDVPDEGVRIGSDPECGLHLPHPTVLGAHAWIRPARGASRRPWRIEGASQATVRVNGVGIAPGEPFDLGDGDVVGIGAFEIAVRVLDPVRRRGTTPGLSSEEIRRRVRACDARPSASLPRHTRVIALNGLSQGRAVPDPPRGVAWTLGRSSRCDVKLPHPSVSRRHALLGRDGRGLWIRDLGGAGGVVVAGRRTRGRSRLGVGDRVDVGELRFEVVEASPGLWPSIPRSPEADAGPAVMITDPAGLTLGLLCVGLGLALLAWG